MKDSDPPKDKGKREKRPKKISARYLRNAGLAYLQRYPSSVSNFRFVMTRKIKRSCAYHTDQSFEDSQALLETLIAELIELGLLNDSLYALGMVRSLIRRGDSPKQVFMKLQRKGLDKPDIAHALKETEEELSLAGPVDLKLNAALTLARRKRIGPFRGERQTAKTPEQELGILARAGYDYQTARRVLEFDEDAAREVLRI